MADGRPDHGKNGYIYLSGVAICEANAWALAIAKATAETTEFCTDWNRQLAGKKSWSGSLTAWQHQDKRVIIDAVLADGPVAMFIYPDSDDPTNFFSGDATFSGYDGSGSTEAAIAGNATFVGDGELTITGFA